MDFTYNEKTVMSSGGFIPSTNDTPLDARGRVNLYSEIKDIPNPYVGMEIRVLQDETNEGKMTKYKVTKLLSNEFGVPNSYIDTDTLEKISESLSDEDLVFDGICEDELGVITPQLKTDYNLTTTDKTIVGAINELKEALANITIGDNGEAVNLPFNSIDKGLASSNIDFSEIKNGNYCYIIRGTIGYDIPDGNLPLNNDMVHITKSNTAMTIITLSGGIYTYNGGTNGTDYISCTKDNFMTYSVASETYQLKNDSKLITTDKTVVGAINELKNALDSGVNGVSTILTVSPTYEELDTLPEGSKVYILNGLGYNGDPVHINKSSNTITLISIDGAINKYQKVGNSWSNYSTENWATQKYVDTAIANVQLGGESGSVDLSEYQKITDSSLATTDKNIVGAINEVKSSVDGITVPTKVSDLENDSNFVTNSKMLEAIANAQLGGGESSDIDLSIYQPIEESTLTTTAKTIPTAINELKSGLDDKVNKTDANKLNCVTINNVSLKEYILTNFTETEKTYYLIAKTTCTDLPKASNFYITVETPGLYTYKVTAKELNDSNGIYVCTYRTISSSWTAWEKVCTTTVADVTETPIEFDETALGLTISNNHSIYKVINGICYATIELLVDAPSENKSYGYTKVNTTNLPKIGFNTKYIINVEGANSTISAVLDKGTTEIKFHGDILAKEGTYIIQGSFSYPVAGS